MRNQHHHIYPFTSSLACRLLVLGAIILLFAGCAQLSLPPAPSPASPAEIEVQPEADTETAEEIPQPLPEAQEEPETDKLYEWNGSGRNVSRVVIDTNEQRARFYDGQEQVGWTTIATGVSAHPTPSGEFEVIEKVAKKRSNLYGRIYNADGSLHKSDAHSSDSIPAGGKFVGARMPYFMRMTYDGIGLHAGAIPRPGQPASHGCIRLPDEIASSLFAKADIGTRVTVIGQGPDYGNYAERIRRQREQERLNRVAAAEAQAEERRNNASERSPSAAGMSEDNVQQQANAAEANASTSDINGNELSRGADETASTTPTDTQGADETASATPTDTQGADRAQASRARTDSDESSTDESQPAEPLEPAVELTEEDREAEDREPEPAAGPQEPAPRPRELAPPSSPDQATPGIRAADQEDSATAEDERS